MDDATMREVVLDTETTGLDHSDGHRIVEIGALEMVNHIATGQTFHAYINPERDIDPETASVHGLTSEILAGKPVFAEIADEFLEFLGDSPLVIHNAPFDMGFINAELARLGRPAIPAERAVDTLQMARQRFPGARASLDALCARFEIDNSHRQLHGAMVDTDLLAEVYVELLGGRQPALSFGEAPAGPPEGGPRPAAGAPAARAPRPHAPSREEAEAHDAFVETLNNPLWAKVAD